MPHKSSMQAWSVFLAGGLLAAALYAFVPNEIVSGLAFSAVGIGAGTAIITGIRRHRPQPAWPWRLLSAACFLFLAGALLRTMLDQHSGLGGVLPDCFTIPGYLCMFLALGGFLRARVGDKRHAVIDGLLIGVGVTIVFTMFFAVPAASIAGREAAVSALAGVYPLLDGVLVLLVANLAFATRRGPAFTMLLGCMALLLTGDVAYAIIGNEGELVGSPLLDLPFLLGFTLIGASGLHPSMADIGRQASLPIQAWSARRLFLIAPALAVPFVLGVLIEKPTPFDRVLLAVGGAAIVALLLARAVSAVRGYAAAQHRYEHQATHDSLTGLANRSLWFTEVREMLAQPVDGEEVWVYFLDLDGFKYVNDSRGHMAGDQVIAEVAGRLRGCAPDAAMIARVGGDEFVVAYRATREGALALAEVILQTMRQTLRMPGADVVVSVSIGISSSTRSAATKAGHTRDGEVTAEDLLRDADTAMYQAKANGRDGWVIFDPVMRDRVRERIDIDLALREAMALGQLHLAFQPVAHMPSGRIVGAEALLRWTHPDRGLIGPATFIPVAEESGLIIDIGRWVMHEALYQLAQWRADGVVAERFWLSINVSPRQLRDTRLPGELASALREYGLPPSAVAIELTESVMIESSGTVDQTLRELRELGVSLVVDDFGTGFSALGYLRNYPVTGVKIDKSFVVGLGHNPEDEAIVRAVAAMSEALQLSVVAEGVQDETQRELLSRIGVTYGQGWLWGHAVSAGDFARRWSVTPPLKLQAGASRLNAQ
ncbi:MAG: EAL domain-containing protein [Hamadaea sp.]|uniref:putative bifunctional diguanylate cyclase/phosphodiesterase n=1 Tax=Hamadaea sp. TaxID=2024425 RepID=UPI0018050355|nr:EAL domain-containing protein [Hamadaea sp.]NUR70505.1 EAL domain-containing protein [Hamadaea sp.]NUT18112.1 EAL domain-containing protein [Hamadaea sp.]